MPHLAIAYAITRDNFDGSPWMPDGSDYWAIVARKRGRTKWRRIVLHHFPRRRLARSVEGSTRAPQKKESSHGRS
jgi:hypothetical protein